MPGMTILHYEFLEKIGAGGMGEIFKAHDTRLNRHVAIKALPYGMSSDPDRRRRFIQEAQTASALNHPNIITIHDVFHEGDTHFIVMEYVPGRTLLESIPAGGMRISEMLLCSAQMASALSAAHDAGIVHRDFKPANVMVGASGLVKVLDFGLAKLLQPLWMTNSSGASGQSATIQMAVQASISGSPQTAEGSILGTVNYMAPEQAEGKKVDGRADIFALGAVMYEMVTGRRAFQADSDIATLSAVLRDDVKPMSGAGKYVPPELENLIRVCLRKDPNARWQTMKEVEVALIGLKRRSDAGEFSGPLAAVTIPSASPKRVPILGWLGPLLADRKKIAIISGVFAAALLAGASGLWIVKSRSHAPVAVQTSAPVTQPAQPAPEAPAVPDSASATPPTPAPPDAAPVAPKKVVPAPAPPLVASSTPASAAPPAAAPAVTAAPVPAPPKAVKAVAASVAAPPVTVSVGDGIAFSIALAEDVRNDADEGAELTFRAAEDVKVGDVVLIPRGATVKGAVVNGNGKHFLGMGGKMTFQLKSAETVDGQKIPLRASVARRPDGPTTRPVDTGRYAKPKELAAGRGTDYIAYIDGDHTITLHAAQTR